MTRKTGTEMAEELSNFTNSMLSTGREEFIKGVTTDHRTLQDDMFKMFFGCIEEWSKLYEQGNYDGRNEGSLKLANTMIEALKEKGIYWLRASLIGGYT